MSAGAMGWLMGWRTGVWRAGRVGGLFSLRQCLPVGIGHRRVGSRHRVARVLDLLLVVEKTEQLRLHHLAQHARRQRIGLAVIVDVNVQAVHDVEVRVGEEFFQRGLLDFRRHVARHEARVVGLRRERIHVGQGRRRG